jgi:hypothetical protein
VQDDTEHHEPDAHQVDDGRQLPQHDDADHDRDRR